MDYNNLESLYDLVKSINSSNRKNKKNKKECCSSISSSINSSDGKINNNKVEKLLEKIQRIVNLLEEIQVDQIMKPCCGKNNKNNKECCCFCVNTAAELQRQQINNLILQIQQVISMIEAISANPTLPDSVKDVLITSLNIIIQNNAVALQQLNTQYAALINKTCVCP